MARTVPAMSPILQDSQELFQPRHTWFFRVVPAMSHWFFRIANAKTDWPTSHRFFRIAKARTDPPMSHRFFKTTKARTDSPMSHQFFVAVSLHWRHWSWSHSLHKVQLLHTVLCSHVKSTPGTFLTTTSIRTDTFHFPSSALISYYWLNVKTFSIPFISNIHKMSISFLVQFVCVFVSCFFLLTSVSPLHGRHSRQMNK